MEPRNEEEDPAPYPDFMNKVKPKAPEFSNVFKDPSSVKDKKDNSQSIESAPLILKNYQGFLDPGNYIPPDQHLAVGPTHLMATDNGRFRIWDKNGFLIKTISATAWFSSALSGASPFDPKVEYDALSKRWIMVWLHQSNTAMTGYYLVSVSDDSIPLGIWYNYAIKSSLFGSNESGTWSDYQGVGYDNQAVYITGRQFVFNGSFQGCKLRILPKTQLYANTAGPLGWTDMWDLRDPNTLSIRPDVVRPSVFYSTGSEYYFMTIAPFTSGTYLILYKLTNPLTSPVLTGVDIPVTAYNGAPNANQLGGGSLLIEAGGSAIRNEPTFRNGFLWATHSVASSGGFSNVNYVKIDPTTNAVIEDAAFGDDSRWHFYPALSVDQNMNLLLNFSLSSNTEYIGAYITSRLNSDPPGTFNGSTAMQVGKSNYVKDFGSGRNRWGDYSGSWLDPSDLNNFWIVTQYAESPQNTWASQISKIRLVPFSGPRAYTFVDTLNFGSREVGTTSDTISLKIYNYGSSQLNITNLQTGSNQFHYAPISFPVNLNYQDSLTVRMLYSPTTAGNIFDSLTVVSNDIPRKVYLKGHGFTISSAVGGTMYGVTGLQESGVLITINTANGTGTTVGPTNFSQLAALSVRKSNGNLYGIYPSVNSTLVRINAQAGDAYSVTDIPLQNVKGIAFDLNDDMYFSVTDGRLFKFNLASHDTIPIGNTNIPSLYGIAINPLNGQMWGVSLTTGSVYKINKTNATSVQLGNTGFSVTPSITFGLSGNMYGVSGLGAQISTIFSIDTATGTGTQIGSTGKHGVSGIAIPPFPIGILPISNSIPDKFQLHQNYPNPFNPSTKIQFDLPKQSFVKIRVYDITGRELAILVNENLNAGIYKIDWNALNYPSGVYFYRIETKDYTISKKMILLK